VTLLGEGGMGEVLLCDDRRIRRQVAMKVLRRECSSKPEERARFFREALAQGQLEHPSIVPVHDVGSDESGSLFFTMRRVRGTTLEEILGELKSRAAPFEQKYSRQKLLLAFANVCLAIDYAHQHGVLHCDLKPGNVMLGSYGEVYVLDWGLAHRTGARDDDEHGVPSGTPGFIAPELIRGSRPDVRSDVFSLGSMLYELLTLEPLHDGADARELFVKTLAGAVVRPSLRAPDRDVPPELETICLKATEVDAAHRYASVRELHDDLEKYLEGDRDHHLRRSMSHEHAARAAAMATRSTNGDHGDSSARSEALRMVGRALALDPENAEALRTLVELLTRPPQEMPPEAIEEMAAEERGFERVRARAGALGFFMWLAFVPFMVFIGVRSALDFALCTAAWAIASATMAYYGRHPRHDGRSPTLAPIIAAVAVALSSLIAGPLIVTPMFATVFAIGFSLSMPRKRRFLPAIAGCLSILVPEALQTLGVLPRSVAYADGIMHILPQMMWFTQEGHVNLVLCDLVCVLMACYFGLSIRQRFDEVQRRVHVNNWQLRQLLPQEARSASGSPPP
jgi:serine/threonine-protein kinase